MKVKLIAILLVIVVLAAACWIFCKPCFKFRACGLSKAASIVADGKTDNTQTIQQAMDEVRKKGGGRVQLPVGKILVSGSLRIPEGVALVGVNEANHFSDPQVGTIVMSTAGRGREDGPALFELGNNAAVIGLSVLYPDQVAKDIQPYPWTFHLQGRDNRLEDITLFNSYNAIRVGPEVNIRFQVRNVYGCALRRGFYVDNCVDIGRLDNVHFHCEWFHSGVGGDWDLVFDYMSKNFEAFTFGRIDWAYVHNTFVFPARVGYKFVKTANGACNGQFSGIGADATWNAIVVEDIQPMGLLISNGEFVSMSGPDPIQVLIGPNCAGSVRFSNCAFWGPSEQCVVSSAPEGYVSLENCYFSSSRGEHSGRALVEASAGRLQVRGCTFHTTEPSIDVLPGVVHAILSDNNGKQGVRIRDGSGGKTMIRDNEPAVAVKVSPTTLTMSWLRKPEGMGEKGRVQVTIENKGKEPISDEVVLDMLPHDAGISFERGRKQVTLAAGQRMNYEFDVAQMESRLAVRARLKKEGSTQAVLGHIDLSRKVTVAMVPTVPELKDVQEFLKDSPALPIYNNNKNEVLGVVRFGLAAGHLIVAAKVNDKNPQLNANPWEGSDLEIFTALKPDKPTGQAFLIPGIDKQTARALYKEGDVPTSAADIQITSENAPYGYRLFAVIPLSRLKIDPLTKQFYIEFTLSTFDEKGVSLRGSTFQSQPAYLDASKYGRVTVK
ncbi:MAG: hypothetical protein SGI71_00345 [Verrucomicrobiota bacterium]|nr:hypothetical protein [Verrucomicrobiota bacterium]